MRYTVVVHKAENSDYGVTVLDLLGCFSAGETLDQALSNSVEAITCHSEGLLTEGENLKPLLLSEDHLHNPDYADGFFAVVDVDLCNWC